MKALNKVFALLGLATLLLFVPPCSGQTYLVQTYSENDGLPSSTVIGVLQDRAGVMWFGTRSGIVSFDGLKWRPYYVEDGLPSISQHRLAMDDLGRIWTLPDTLSLQGVYFDGERWRVGTSSGQFDSKSRYTCFAVTVVNEEARVAVGTDVAGVNIYFGGVWKNYHSRNGLLGDKVRSVVGRRGLFYVATNRGLSVIDGDNIDNSLNRGLNLPDADIAGMKGEETGETWRLWLVGASWAGFIDNGTFRLEATGIPIVVNKTSAELIVEPDGRGGIYYGNNVGLCYLRGKNGQVDRLGRLSGLISEGASDFCLDREKNLWVTCLRGVSKLVSMRFANYRKVDGLLDNEVSAALEPSPGKYIFGHNNGLTFYDGIDFKTLLFDKKKTIEDSATRVLDMESDGHGNLWMAGSGAGLAVLDSNGRIRWFGEKEGLKGSVTSVRIDRAGRLWVSTDSGLSLYSSGTFSLVPLGKKTFIRRIVRGPQNVLFLLTANMGVIRRNDEGIQYFSSPDKVAANNVYSVLVDSRGRTLVGTLGGLYEIKNDSLAPFEAGGFRIDRSVYIIVEDSKQRLWFGTDNGIVRWDGTTSRNYTLREGFVGRETNRAAGFADSRGQVWFGSDLGISCYREEFDPDPQTIPPPIVGLATLEAEGLSVPLDKPADLPYDKNSLVFHFRAVSFIDEKAVRYRSRLEGFDKDWLPEYESVNREIRYTNLLSGRYRFHLQAKNGLNVWSAPVSSAWIVIRKPYWRQGWFYGLALLLTAAVFYVVQKAVAQAHYAKRLEGQVRERTTELRESLKEKEVLLKEIHHRVKNNLQVVSSLLYLQSKKINDSGTLEIFKESIHRIRSMALIHETLYRSPNLANIDMSEYIEKLASNVISSIDHPTSRIRLELDVCDASLQVDVALNCGLIINELVTNSLKYAFPHDRPGTVRIGLSAEPSSAGRGNRETAFILTVADDGVGIPENFDIQNSKSLGLQLVHNLVKQIDGTIELERRSGTAFIIRWTD